MEIIAPLITITAVILLVVTLCWPPPRPPRANPGALYARAVTLDIAPIERGDHRVSAETVGDPDEDPIEELEPEEPTLERRPFEACVEDRWGTSAWTIEPMLACGDSGAWEREVWSGDD